MELKEIINPSDEAYIDVSDKEAACLAVAFLSKGKFAIDDIMPVFIFGGSDDWFKDNFERDVDASYNHVGKERLSKALKTVFLSSERTSVYDIVKSARWMAENLI